MEKLKFKKEKKYHGGEVTIVEIDCDKEITAIVSRNGWAPVPGDWKEFTICKGGTLKIIGGDPERGIYKVEYKTPPDFRNNDGRIFEILKETFLAMQAENKIVKYFEKREKEIIREILRHPYKKDQIIIKNVEKDDWIKVKNLESPFYNESKLIKREGKLITLGLVEFSSCRTFYLVKYENSDMTDIADAETTSALAPNGTIFWRTIHFEKEDDLFDDIISQK